MKARSYEIFTALLFAFIAIVHLMRFALGWTAQVGTFTFPVWASIPAVILCGLLAIWGLTLARKG